RNSRHPVWQETVTLGDGEGDVVTVVTGVGVGYGDGLALTVTVPVTVIVTVTWTVTSCVAVVQTLTGALLALLVVGAACALFDAEADTEADPLEDGVAATIKSSGLELSVADAVELDSPPVEFAAGLVAGACVPSITYSSTPTAAAAAAKPAGSTHLRPELPPPRLPPVGKPFSSKRPARSAIRVAKAAPAGSRRLSSTRDRTPGGINECESSSNSRSGLRFFTVALQIVHFSMCLVADCTQASTPRPSSWSNLRPSSAASGHFGSPVRAAS